MTNQGNCQYKTFEGFQNVKYRLKPLNNKPRCNILILKIGFSEENRKDWAMVKGNKKTVKT